MTTATTFPILKNGSQGAAVQELQTLLNYYFGIPALGGPIAVDGIFGAVTENRVKIAQYRYLLKQDGIVGSQTWQALRTNTAPIAVKPTLRRGSQGTDVEIIQRLLKDGGFYQSAVDQVFGPQTEASVRAFQRDRRLVGDGVVGPKTWAVFEELAILLTFDEVHGCFRVNQ